MKLPYCLLLAFCLGGLFCGLSNVKPDPDMMKSMEEVVNRYQGKISYTYGVSASSSKRKSKYFELTLEESQLVNSSDDEYKQVAAEGWWLVIGSYAIKTTTGLNFTWIFPETRRR